MAVKVLVPSANDRPARAKTFRSQDLVQSGTQLASVRAQPGRNAIDFIARGGVPERSLDHAKRRMWHRPFEKSGRAVFVLP
jgi:hypothetical protein